MLMQRCQNLAIAISGILLPLLIACAIILAIEFRKTRPADDRPGRTPNPAKAPWYSMGPGDLLVGLDPWFAGTLLVWLVSWCGALSAYVIGVAMCWPTGSTTTRAIGRLIILSVVLGLLFAAPWYYALVRSLFESIR